MARRKRGLGTDHDNNRRRLMGLHIDGSACWWCGQPMWKEQAKNWDGRPLAADHSVARKYGGHMADRLLHFTCNSQRGAGDNDTRRPALKPVRKNFQWGTT